ncbi:Sister chromatid cohesion 1 protein 1 [Acorus gramineus]|uniref:Sister chromatid cohesion 1 protein 1 n=1 Tax=Acorus gramineus TaxID=55184 RepID=A0AAV9B058_ACOGR|nr:Sister chromatid cohesion 1 protein 1 [Acorus gramineus]
MAATMHAKLNRRNLNKLNLVKICEEILNPSVPMALRLSGILMGGVVIVYERKVKLLYDDVSRLLVEINEAWKVKPTSTDPTVLPRGKTQAKFEAVTLPYNDDTDAAGEVEQPLHNKGVQRGGFLLQLDDVEDAYININPGEDESTQQHHQADPANITLFGDVDSYVAEMDLNNRFERFDIDGEGETNLNFTSHEHPEIPTTFMPSPPPPDASPQELLEETGPTQTPLPNLNPSIDKTTQSIRTHLKLHFDTPGNPQVESLDSLASGMNRRRAAMLFYQTCVLATCDYVKVEQSVPYGEIFLSKGPNM